MKNINTDIICTVLLFLVLMCVWPEDSYGYELTLHRATYVLTVLCTLYFVIWASAEASTEVKKRWRRLVGKFLPFPFATHVALDGDGRGGTYRARAGYLIGTGWYAVQHQVQRHGGDGWHTDRYEPVSSFQLARLRAKHFIAFVNRARAYGHGHGQDTDPSTSATS